MAIFCVSPRFGFRAERTKIQSKTCKEFNGFVSRKSLAEVYLHFSHILVSGSVKSASYDGNVWKCPD
jgi:hypothetical protein